jgi:hypothetical protein
MRMCTASQSFLGGRQKTYVFLGSGDTDGIGDDQSRHSFFDSLDLAER